MVCGARYPRFVIALMCALCLGLHASLANVGPPKRKSVKRYTESAQKTDDPKKVVQNYFKYAFDKKWGHLERLLAPDVKFFGPKMKDTLSKEMILQSWKNTHIKNDTMYCLDAQTFILPAATRTQLPWVCVAHYYIAKFHHAEYNIWYTTRVHVRAWVHKGQIKIMHMYVNQADIQQQLGYKHFKPDEFKRLQDSLRNSN